MVDREIVGTGRLFENADRRKKSIMALTASERREQILSLLSENRGVTLSASALAAKFGVSRQIIVGDIALMRAGGVDIVSTARGYRLQGAASGFVRILTCRHTGEQLLEELYAIVDNGGAVLDIAVEHPVYGVLSAPLRIFSRFDAEELFRALEEKNAAPLLTLSDGVHTHTISCPNEESYIRICQKLKSLGILAEEKK